MLLSISSAGPASQAARQSLFPQPPAPAAPNAAQTCLHLHSKVDSDPPLKPVTVKHWYICVNRVLAVLAAPSLAMLMGYELIAYSGDQNKTCDDKALCFRCRMRSGIYSHVIETKIMEYKIEF